MRESGEGRMGSDCCRSLGKAGILDAREGLGKLRLDRQWELRVFEAEGDILH